MNVWNRVAGQSSALSLLKTDALSNRVAHAYLFAGEAGREPLEAGLAMSAALVCSEGGCGYCESCRRVAAGAHPDVEVISPAGTQLLVDQVRDVVRDAWRSPLASARRVIIVDEADRMNPNAQNAFLKALEEPPPSATLILLCPNTDALLETVRSRCREIRFRTPGETEIIESLIANGSRVDEAGAAARAGGTLHRALALATDSSAAQRREDLVSSLLVAPRNPADSLALAAQLRDAVREAGTVSDEDKEIATAQGDWLRETKKATEDRLKREQRRTEQDALETSLDDMASVLRDLIVVAAGSDAALVNEPLLPKLAGGIGPKSESQAIAGLNAIDLGRRRLRANGNVLLTLEQVFLSVHAALALV